MNFFEHQDLARARSGRLVWMFAAAVLAVIVSVYVVAVVAFGMMTGGEVAASGGPAFRFWQPQVALVVVPLVAATIGVASLIRVRALRQGGAAIAASIGGREVDFHTRDAAERRLINVVEEIAIASGVPVPRVFVLENEAGINAFAAGYSIQDAAIGVTRGCIEKLDRDELQGVVAHEFAHILNGDMRLNIRLIGFIAGLVVIGVTGRMVLRAVFHGAGRSRRRSNDNNGGAAIAMLVVGLGLIVIGFVGTLAGQAIQAAISRQREFLADASAVQFTRDPNGLRGALARIAGIPEHGEIVGGNVSDMRHMFFSSATSAMFGGFATHPPLEERIRRLGGAVPTSQARGRQRAAGGSDGPPIAALAGQTLAARAGNPSDADVQRARTVLGALPDAIRSAAHDPTYAPALIHALLLADASTVVSAQLRALARNISPSHAAAVESLATQLRGIPSSVRLPILELAAPTLRAYPEATRAAFVADTQRLVAMDGLSLAEALLLRCVERWVSTEARPSRTIASPRGNARWVQDAALVVTAGVASIANASDDAAAMLGQARAAVGPRLREALPEGATAVNHGDVLAALDRLSVLSGAVRQELLSALTASVLADRRVTRDEADLCGAVAVLVGAPLPLLEVTGP